MDGVDGLYLSLDIDAVSGIRGVSAAASVGISREVWLQLVRMITGTGKVIGVDLVETSSRGSAMVDDDTVQLACDTIRTICSL
jgi:arginase family enzyme